MAGTSAVAPGLVSAERRKRMQVESDDDSDVTCKRRWHWIVLKCVCARKSGGYPQAFICFLQLLLLVILKTTAGPR